MPSEELPPPTIFAVTTAFPPNPTTSSSTLTASPRRPHAAVIRIVSILGPALLPDIHRRRRLSRRGVLANRFQSKTTPRQSALIPTKCRIVPPSESRRKASNSPTGRGRGMNRVPEASAVRRKGERSILFIKGRKTSGVLSSTPALRRAPEQRPSTGF